MITIKHITGQADLTEAFHIRRCVFVEEQQIPQEDEFDIHDLLAEHVLAFIDGQPGAAGRLRLTDRAAKLERICVLAHYRGRGLGKAVVEALEDLAIEKGCRSAMLHAQTHAAGFYLGMGYASDMSEFMEDGIPHILMVKNLVAPK